MNVFHTCASCSLLTDQHVLPLGSQTFQILACPNSCNCIARLWQNSLHVSKHQTVIVLHKQSPHITFFSPIMHVTAPVFSAAHLHLSQLEQLMQPGTRKTSERLKRQREMNGLPNTQLAARKRIRQTSTPPLSRPLGSPSRRLRPMPSG